MERRRAGRAAVVAATIRAASCAALLALVACAPGPDSHPPTETAETAETAANGRERRDADLDALRALPYVHWSGRADPALRGVVLHDRSRAWPGVNLYTNDRDQAYLMDMEGRRLHTWRVPETRHHHCEHAELLDDGKLAVICVNDALFILDRRSDVLLDHRAKVHHDLAPLTDGTLIVADKAIHPYRRRMVYFDGLTWLGPRGETLRTWSTWKHLSAIRQLHPPSPLDRPGDWWKLLERSYDYYHLNTVESLPATTLGERDARFRAGNLLLCLRNPGLVLVVDRDRGDVVWSWGSGQLDGPHLPTLLENGRLLIFDNGTERDYSRVIELDPLTLEVTWEYRADPPQSFHSKWRGSSQRLPNGDTLICDADAGHVFEVTPEGERVWEFWNPELRRDRRKGIYRFTRVAPERVAWALGDPETLGDPATLGDSETRR
jgi:hypothetical protein